VALASGGARRQVVWQLLKRVGDFRSSTPPADGGASLSFSAGDITSSLRSPLAGQRGCDRLSNQLHATSFWNFFIGTIFISSELRIGPCGLY